MALQIKKVKMVRKKDPPESDDSVSEISVKSDYNVIRDVISDEEAERKKTSKLSLTPTSKAKAIEKSKESRAKEKKDPRPPLPRLRKEEEKEKKEEEDERPPIERRVPAKGKGKGSVASARPALSKGTSKGKDKDSAVPARQFVTPRRSLKLKDMRVMIQKSHLQSLCRRGHQRVLDQMM